MKDLKVVNLRHCTYKTLRVDRSSKWGNPFVITKYNNRDQVIRQYTSWIRKRPWLIDELIDVLEESEYVHLGCWCVPQRCHAHVLLELVNERRRK